jgi:voltage-gated potassium channel Kch
MNHPDMDIATARRVQRNFRLLALAALTMVGLGTIVMRLVEKLSWVDAFYFSVVSLTTVGYGDITPTSDFAKLFVSFYILIGIGIIAAFASNLVKNAVAKRVIKQSDQQ